MLPKSRLLHPLFHLLNPIFRAFGPEINRRTDENIRMAGFRIVKEYMLLGSVFRLMVAERPLDSKDEASGYSLKRSEPSGDFNFRRFIGQSLLPLRLTQLLR
jgi:demethylmenaquinone methyltransferase/2-methoxy-6-polyprenyl-1,4-benzoquinol methylase